MDKLQLQKRSDILNRELWDLSFIAQNTTDKEKSLSAFAEFDRKYREMLDIENKILELDKLNDFTMPLLIPRLKKVIGEIDKLPNALWDVPKYVLIVDWKDRHWIRDIYEVKEVKIGVFWDEYCLVLYKWDGCWNYSTTFEKNLNDYD